MSDNPNWPIAPFAPPGTPSNLTVSGTSDYNPPTGNIIYRAFRILGVINENDTITPGMVEDGLDSLNALIKELETTGIHLWTTEEAILFTQQYQARYELFTGGPSFCCSNNAWQLSSLGPNAAQGATSIALSGNLGMAAAPLPVMGNSIGINLDSGQTFWTTISAAPTGTYPYVTIPLAAPLPGSSSAGEFCFWFDPRFLIKRPLRIPAARRINYNVGQSGSSIGPIETPLTNMLSRKEYMDLPNKQNPGAITQVFYNPARDRGELFCWNTPPNGDSGLRFTYYRPLDDFRTVNDLADLPQEWDNTLKWNLAVELGPSYDVPAERWDRIVKSAAVKLESAMGFDREPQSVYFGVSYDQTRR